MENQGGISVGKQFYITWIACQLESIAPVWHSKLTQKESNAIENVQKKCFKIILRRGYTSYEEACKTLEMLTQHERREKLCFNFVKNAMKNLPHLYPKDENARNTRQGGNTHMLIPPYTTDIHKNSGKTALGLLYNRKLDDILKNRNDIGNEPLPSKTRKSRCKNCPECLRDECARCINCLDMKKYGGQGKKKQACLEKVCKKNELIVCKLSVK